MLTVVAELHRILLDSLPNELLKGCRETLAPILARIFTACLDIRYYLVLFKESITVVLRKPQKPDYTKLGAYRPIVLLNMLAKTLEAIIARRISKEAESRGLLPKTYIGAQLGRSTTTVLDLITEQVRTIWQTSLDTITLMLCFNISRAFDNMSYQRLLYNIRMQGYLDYILQFLASFLQDKTTRLRLGKFVDRKRL